MKQELKRLQKAITYQKKQQEQAIEAQIGLLNARITNLIEEGQTKPVTKALRQLQPMITREISSTDLRTLSALLEGL